MSDANSNNPLINTNTYARTSSLANLVHKTETNPTRHPQVSDQPNPTRNDNHHRHHRLTHPVDSDDGSQQERNHQRPRPLSNLPRLPLPQEVSGTGTPARRSVVGADCSPKHPYRKRKHSQIANPPELVSLTQKPEDHASSVAQPIPRERLHGDLGRPLKGLEGERGEVEPQEGSTEITPARSVGVVEPGAKHRRRLSGKEAVERTELLEENRSLRIELEAVKYRLKKVEAAYQRQKKELAGKDGLLEKYRIQLVGLFETGDGDLFTINKEKHSADSLRNAPGGKVEFDSKIDGESISNSQEEDWSTYSAPSVSQAYEDDKSEDRRRRADKDRYARSEARIRKRTRAPAWTPQEEVVFMQSYDKHGCRWKMFQDSLPGRSRRQIQSHGSYLIRQGKLLKKNSRPWQRRKPRGDSGNAGPSSSVKDAEVEIEEGADASDRD